MSKPVIDFDGFVKVELQFDAITFKPLQDEFIDIEVTEINQTFIMGQVGPINSFFVPQRELTPEL